MPLSPLSSSSGFCWLRRRCGALMVVSVLMLTTLGPSCLAICEKALESCCGEGTDSGVASDDEPLWPSLPFTPKETMVPIKMPSASVATMLNEYIHRRAFKRTKTSRESILSRLQNLERLLYASKNQV